MKLPINPFLYLVSAACAGGIVLSILGTVTPRIDYGKKKDIEIRAKLKDLVDRGGKVVPDIGDWDYRNADGFWHRFHSANFTGYVPPQAVDPVDQVKDATPRVAPDVDLNETLVVICISFGGEHTRVLVQYADPVGVSVPARLARSRPPVGDVVGTPPARGRGRRMPPTPVMSSAVPTHHLAIGDHLWNPYHNFFLAAVADDARSVFFEDRGKPKVDDNYPRQELVKNELGLPLDV